MSEFREPWKIEELVDFDYEPYNVIVNADGTEAIGATHHGGDCCDCRGRLDITDAEAARICAAVNFCRNLPTDFLERYVADWKNDEPIKAGHGGAIFYRETSE